MTPEAAVIATIRALGFVGNMHYCPGCLNTFHDDRGQHSPRCLIADAIREDEDWWEDVEKMLEEKEEE